MVRLLPLLALLLLVGCVRLPDPPTPPPPPTDRELPRVNAPFIVATTFQLRNPIFVDVRLRYHGCDEGTGAPTGVTGAMSIYGDLEYRFDCPWSVFDKTGRLINGAWVTFDRLDGEQQATVWMWAGWEENYPLRPPPLDVARGCGPTPPIPTGVTFTYSVRDIYGGMASHSVVLGGR